VRVGDTVITQRDFNADAGNLPPARIAQSKPGILREMISRRLFLLHAQEHPDLVDPAKLEKKLEEAYKLEGVKTREELEAKLKSENRLTKLQDFIDRNRAMMARIELTRRAEKLAADESHLREVFDRDPTAFDGTRMRVRHIVKYVLPWDTPEARREQAARIREDLVSGRRTWEQAVNESDEVSTRIIGGDLGYVPRHLEKPEAVAKAAFALKPGETSEVIESTVGYHILQVTDVHKGQTKFEKATYWIRSWVIREPIYIVDAEMRAKYPVIGVREPDLPPPPPPSATRPAAVTRPQRAAVTTRPQLRRPGTTMPARSAPPRPTPRPAPASRPAGRK
jgi:peptidyl-prolyl cis-trans isomerase C